MEPKPLYKIDCIDAFKWLDSLEDKSIDLIITDPPYESLNKHRGKGTTTRLKNNKITSDGWFKTISNDMFHLLFIEMYRVLKKNTHCYVFCDQETMFYIKRIGEKVGFKFWKPIVWDKVKIGMGYHYRSRYEFVLFFEKGKRRLKDLGIPDIIEIPKIHDGYPTEKPVELAKVFIKQSTEHGDLVIDPFIGSGAFGVAAIESGCNFAGVDICKEAVDISNKRLTKTDGLYDSDFLGRRIKQELLF